MRIAYLYNPLVDVHRRIHFRSNEDDDDDLESEESDVGASEEEIESSSVLVEQLRQRIVRMSLNYFDGETLYKQKEAELVAALKECMQAMDECVSLLNINGVVHLPSSVTNVIEKYSHYSPNSNNNRNNNNDCNIVANSNANTQQVKDNSSVTVAVGSVPSASPPGGKRSVPGSPALPNKKRRNSFAQEKVEDSTTTILEEDVAAKLVAISSLSDLSSAFDSHVPDHTANVTMSSKPVG